MSETIVFIGLSAIEKNFKKKLKLIEKEMIG
jgi:hypothetical protein